MLWLTKIRNFHLNFLCPHRFSLPDLLTDQNSKFSTEFPLSSQVLSSWLLDRPNASSFKQFMTLIPTLQQRVGGWESQLYTQQETMNFSSLKPLEFAVQWKFVRNSKFHQIPPKFHLNKLIFEIHWINQTKSTTFRIFTYNLIKFDVKQNFNNNTETSTI